VESFERIDALVALAGDEVGGQVVSTLPPLVEATNQRLKSNQSKLRGGAESTVEGDVGVGPCEAEPLELQGGGQQDEDSSSEERPSAKSRRYLTSARERTTLSARGEELRPQSPPNARGTDEACETATGEQSLRSSSDGTEDSVEEWTT
jgi:hypothetical protein